MARVSRLSGLGGGGHRHVSTHGRIIHASGSRCRDCRVTAAAALRADGGSDQGSRDPGRRRRLPIGAPRQLRPGFHFSPVPDRVYNSCKGFYSHGRSGRTHSWSPRPMSPHVSPPPDTSKIELEVVVNWRMIEFGAALAALLVVVPVVGIRF